MFRCLFGLLFVVCASAEAPTLRLGDDVRPVRYRLDLTVVPEQDTFTGRIEIDLDVRKPTEVLWLNARNLTFDDAKFIQAVERRYRCILRAKGRPLPGTQRNLAKVLESIRICMAYKAAQQANVTEFFQKY